MKYLLKVILSFFFCAGVSLASPESEYAYIPYETVVALSVNTNNTSSVKIHVVSSLEVSTADIKLYINSSTGKIELKTNADGSVLVPLTNDLIKENPKIISNQPKKTLSLEGNLHTSGGAKIVDNKVRYNDFMRPIQELNDKITYLETSTGSGPTPPVMLALLVRFQEIELPADIVIKMKSGDVSMPVTPEKWCILVDKKSMRDENPWVELPPHSFKASPFEIPKPKNWEEQ